MKRLYIVRLISKDNAPAEEYCCSLLEDAITFLNAFQYDTSGVYDRIEIVDYDTFRLPYAVLEF